jgi:SAM-dependent methyltransferase
MPYSRQQSVTLETDSLHIPTGNTYDKYGTKNPIERRLVAIFLRSLDGCLPASPPDTVVEIGLGEGEIANRLTQQYPDATVVGIDLPDVDLAEEWRGRGVVGAFADAMALPFKDKSADLVLAIEVLEHLPEPETALREIARVARHRVILSVPWEPVWRLGNILRGKYLRDWGNTPGHIQHWSRSGFVQLVNRHLRVIDLRRPPPWTIVVAEANSTWD